MPKSGRSPRIRALKNEENIKQEDFMIFLYYSKERVHDTVHHCIYKEMSRM